MSKDNQRIGLLRPAPEPLLKEIPPEEAVSLAKEAFYGARLAQSELMAQYLNQMLFSPKTVNYVRLLGLRSEARKQVENAQRVEQLIDDAIAAFKATEPPVARDE